MDININKYKDRSKLDQYTKFINSKSYDTSIIASTVESSIKNIESGEKSFVIYGEPQSGKTDMMIALSAKLVDLNFKCIVCLVQNNLTLEKQNRDRFISSGLYPRAVYFKEILSSDYDLKKCNIIFCTKETNNLTKLISKLKRVKNKIILDDEADHSTPDNNVNDPEKEASRTNAKISELVGEDSIYIGVTATPARLDLNNTLANNAKKWVFFEPHPFYFGYSFFFPRRYISHKEKPQFDLEFLPPEPPDTNSELRKTFFKFLVNASFLNLHHNQKTNFMMLIHTTARILEHSDESNQMKEIIEIISNENHPKWEKFITEIHNIAKKKFIDESTVDNIIYFILENRHEITVSILNTEGKLEILNIDSVTSSPTRIFTVVIGGNIISRGLTFGNLLSMHFSRGVKSSYQQGTYIQRARMFGPRDPEMLKHFHLAIPELIYLNWWECFQNYHIQYKYCRAGTPLWAESSGENIKNKVAPSSSIDKSTVSSSTGVLGFNIVDYNDEIANIFKLFSDKKISNWMLLEKLTKLDNPMLPNFIFDDIELQNPEFDIAIHDPCVFIEDVFKDYDSEEIRRTSGGLFGGGRLKTFSNAIHHFWPLRNKYGKIKLWYLDRSIDRRIRHLKNIKNN